MHILYRIEVKLRKGKALDAGQSWDRWKKCARTERPKQRSIKPPQEKAASGKIRKTTENDSTSSSSDCTADAPIPSSSTSNFFATTTHHLGTLEQGYGLSTMNSDHGQASSLVDPAAFGISYVNQGYSLPTLPFHNSSSNNFRNYNQAWK